MRRPFEPGLARVPAVAIDCSPGNSNAAYFKRQPVDSAYCNSRLASAASTTAAICGAKPHSSFMLRLDCLLGLDVPFWPRLLSY